MSKQYFLKLLLQQIHDLVVFEGPCGSKNLALDSQGRNEELLIKAVSYWVLLEVYKLLSFGLHV